MWSRTAQSWKTFAVFFFFSHSTLGCRHKMLMIIHKRLQAKGCVSAAERLSVPVVTGNQRRGAGPVAADCGSWSPPAREVHPPRLFSANAESMLLAATVHPPTRTNHAINRLSRLSRVHTGPALEKTHFKGKCVSANLINTLAAF